MTFREKMNDEYRSGRKDGFKRGVRKEKYRIAKKMLEAGNDIRNISECTGLSESQIAALKN